MPSPMISGDYTRFVKTAVQTPEPPGVPGRYQSERPIDSEVLLKQLTSFCLGFVDIAWTTTWAINSSTYTMQTARSRDGRQQDN